MVGGVGEGGIINKGGLFQLYVRILLKQCFPNNLKYPALVHFKEICWGVGALSAVVSVT